MKTTNYKWLETMEFSIDWLNGVMDFEGSIFDFFKEIALFDERLSVDHWVFLKTGKYHYNQRFCLNGNASIQVCWNASEDKPFIPYKKGENNNYGIFISISGDGLRFLQQHQNTLGSLFKYFFYNGFRCSRFDVNCDIFEKDNPLVPVVTEAFRWALMRKEGELGISTNVQRKSSNFAVYELFDTYHNEWIYNCQLGNHSTRFGMFRCYNKWLELKDGRLSDVGDAILEAKGNPDYWYRLEYELHKENAADIFNAFASGKITLENAFCAAAEKVFRVIDQMSIGYTLPQCPTNDVWEDFIKYMQSSIHFVQLGEIFTTTPYVPRSLIKHQQWLQHIAKALYAAKQLEMALPDWYDENVVKPGRQRYYEDYQYKTLRDEIGALFGDMQF